MSNEDTLKSLGKVIPKNAAGHGKDAVHIAVMPVIVADEYVAPGDHVGFVVTGPDKGKVTRHPLQMPATTCGIIDPFLKDRAWKGDHVWLFLYPGSITSLRHEWTHPGVVDIKPAGEALDWLGRNRPTPAAPIVLSEKEKEESKVWLRNFANRANLTYDSLMQAALAWRDKDEMHVSGYDTDVFTDEEFWKHWSNVTGNINTDHGNFFSCAC